MCEGKKSLIFLITIITIFIILILIIGYWLTELRTTKFRMSLRRIHVSKFCSLLIIINPRSGPLGGVAPVRVEDEDFGSRVTKKELDSEGKSFLIVDDHLSGLPGPPGGLVSPPGTSSRPTAQEHLGLQEVSSSLKVVLSVPPDGQFTLQDLSLTMPQETSQNFNRTGP